MIWCLIGLALAFVFLAVAVLMVRVPKIDAEKLRAVFQPGKVVRGCVAVVCLLVAVGLVGVVVLAGV